MIASAQIAYVSGNADPTVWVAPVAGRGARRIGLGTDPLLSPNGKLVAYVDLNGHIQIRPTQRLGTYASVANGSASEQVLAWSPDSRYLVAAYTGNHSYQSGLDVIDLGTPGRVGVGPVASGYVSGASFAPSGPDRIVYAASSSVNPSARVDLYTIDADRTHPRRLTRDGRSLDPVWGRSGIAFDRERLRGRDAYPEYQVWLMRGSRSTQITHTSVPSLQEGLVPLGFSANGNRLLAELEGEDTSYAYTIQLRPRRVREVKVSGRLVQGEAISRDGCSLLVDEGGFEDPPNKGRVETVSFGGGAARRLARGAAPSWDL